MRLNLHQGERNKDRAGTREAKHEVEYRKLVGIRMAESTAVVRIKAEGISKNFRKILRHYPPYPQVSNSTSSIMPCKVLLYCSSDTRCLVPYSPAARRARRLVDAVVLIYVGHIFPLKSRRG